MLDELVQDDIDAQQKGRPFHYSWFLPLISFRAWFVPQEYQGLNLPVTCKGARYHNLWFEKDLKDRHKHNTVELFIHGEAIQHHVKNMFILDDAIV